MGSRGQMAGERHPPPGGKAYYEFHLACSKYPTFMPTRRTAATGRQQRHTRVDEFDTACIDKRSSGKTLRLTAPIARSRSRPTAPSRLSLKSEDRQDRSRVLHCRHGDVPMHGPRTDAGVVDCRERAANDGRSSVLPTVEPGARRASL